MKVAARGRAAVLRIVYPGPPAKYGISLLILAYPGAAVRRSIFVVVVPVVLAPFPHVAVHIVETKSVDYPKFPYEGGFFSACFRSVW